jgi:hypothetical protein
MYYENMLSEALGFMMIEENGRIVHLELQSRT